MTNILVYGLATYRIAKLLVEETGPFHLFVWFRSLFGIQHDDSGAPNAWPSGYFGEMLECVYCTSLNIALVIYLLSLYDTKWLMIVLTPFAIAGVAAVIFEQRK